MKYSIEWERGWGGWCVCVCVCYYQLNNLPINRNATQMQNACRREINIQTIVDITHKWAKHPFATGQFHRGIECHGTECDQHICHRQRHHKVVGYYTEMRGSERERKRVTSKFNVKIQSFF